jgi:hypothetical protein
MDEVFIHGQELINEKHDDRALEPHRLSAPPQ